MHIHLVTVSEQVLANLIPALMERPDAVLMLCSPTMAERGIDQCLRRQLEHAGIASLPEVGLGPLPEAGVPALRRYGEQLAEALSARYPQARITFNATGGNKLMTLGLIGAGAALDSVCQRVIYADTAHCCVEVLYAEGDRAPQPIAMPDVLDVATYAAAQGFEVSSHASRDTVALQQPLRKRAAKYLAREAPRLGDFIGALNRLADQALGNDDAFAWPRQAFRSTPHGTWTQALQVLAECELLRWDGRGVEVDLIDIDRTRFLRGGWLEEYAWHVLHDERAHDVLLNVQGRWAGTEAANEFDVLACHRNQLLVVECKTLRFYENENDNEVSYRLESLGRDVRGLFGETWLLSAREPTAVLLDRARQARIKLFGPAQIAKLREQAQRWLTGG